MQSVPIYAAFDAAILDAAIVSAGLAKGTRFFGVQVALDDDKPPITEVYLADDATDDEMAVVDSVVKAYDRVAEAKAGATAAVGAACTAYIYAHYAQPQQSSLNALFTEAAIRGYADRIKYIGQALVWIKAVVDYYHSKEDEIAAATDLVGVAAVTWDFPGAFNQGDPNISLRSAQSMNN